MIDGGIYIVTLTNRERIPVKAADPRFAGRCIKVNRGNCKIGVAKNFDERYRYYVRTFGRQHVRLTPIAHVADLKKTEKVVLAALSRWRVRGSTNRQNEWLKGIDPSEVRRLTFRVMRAAGIAHKRISREAYSADDRWDRPGLEKKAVRGGRGSSRRQRARRLKPPPPAKSRPG